MPWNFTVSPTVTQALSTARLNPHYEIEAIFTGGKYYYQALRAALPPPLRREDSTVYSNKTTHIRYIVRDGHIREERKEFIASYSFPEQSNVYLTVKAEYLLSENGPGEAEYDTIRVRKRDIYPLPAGELALTQVTMTEPNGSPTERYEIELEWNKQSLPAFLHDLNYVYQLIHPSEVMYSQSLWKEVTQQYHSFFHRKIFNRPVPLTYHQLIGSNPIVNSFVSWKANGHRRLLVSYHQQYWLIYPPFEASLTTIPAPSYSVVVDCEVVGDHIYLFDTLLLKDRDYRPDPYRLRYDALLSLPGHPRLTRKDSIPLTVTTFFDRITDLVQDPPSFSTDGLIFTSAGSYRDPVYKWKSPTDLTIDFLVHDHHLLVYDSSTGTEVPFTGTTRYPLPPIEYPASSSDQVYEYRLTDGVLRPLRPRPDKGNANTREVVDDLWPQLFNPLTLDDLTAITMKLVFQYHNRVKRRLFHSSWLRSETGELSILDLGSGRGGDLTKWDWFTTVYAVEPNPANRAELQRRAALLDLPYRLTVLPYYGQDYEAIIPQLPHPVTVVSMMLSLSFFSTYDDLVRTIDQALADQGYLILFTIDGNAIAQIPYEQVTLLNVTLTIGEGITVSIPGSIVGENQREHRVDLSRLFSTLGPSYHLVTYRIADGYDEVPAGRSPLLSDEQLAYTRLYSYLILQKRSSAPPPSPAPVPALPPSPAPPSSPVIPGIVIPTIGDGNCFFHAVLTAISPEYRNSGGAAKRGYARSLRLTIGEALSELDPRYPGYCYWETLSRLTAVELLIFDVNESIPSSYSLSALQRHFADPGNCYIGIEAYPYISYRYQVNLLVVGSGSEIFYESFYERDHQWMVIRAHHHHYELLIPREGHYLWTLSELEGRRLTLTVAPPFDPRAGYQAIGPSVLPRPYYDTLPPWDPLLVHLRPFVSFPLPGNRLLEQQLGIPSALYHSLPPGSSVESLILSDVARYLPYYRILRSRYRYY